MCNEIDKAVKDFKRSVETITQAESEAHFSQQQEAYDEEYNLFITAYEKGECYICNEPFKTVRETVPCLHWLLRRGKFKKKDLKLVYEKFDYYQLVAFLRWVSFAEAGSKNINNLEEESSERKIFETTITWKDIEWTLDCSKNDFAGHQGTKTDFPHWHLQMRICGYQFIKFNDFHIPFSKDDQIKLKLEADKSSGFQHTFGHSGIGMQETMDNVGADFDGFMKRAESDPEQGSVHVQSLVKAPGGISGEKINEALKMCRETGKSLHYCFSAVLESEEDISMRSIVSPADSVPEIAKRTARKRR